ncbi:FRG domain-containing protein [Methanococcus maripaludis]|nr:FRG domain-containing protein [Methanococcus maripaludis]
MDFEIEINSVSELLDYLKDLDELSKLIRFEYIGHPEDYDKSIKYLMEAQDLKLRIIRIQKKIKQDEKELPSHELQKSEILINSIEKNKNSTNGYANELLENNKKALKFLITEIEDKLLKWLSNNQDSIFLKSSPYNYLMEQGFDIKTAEEGYKNILLSNLITLILHERSIQNEGLKIIEDNLKKLENELILFKPKKDILVYRGQKNSKWGLCPSVFRKKDDFEDRLMYPKCEHEFYKSVLEHNLPEFEKQKCIFDRLALMQHYQIPTRLLDWTKNPLVALYFAVEEHQEKGNLLDGRLFVYCPNRIYSSTDFEVKLFCELFEKNSEVCEVSKLKDIEFEGKTLINRYKFNEEGTNAYFKMLLSRILLIKPVITNNRLRVQQGFFSMHGFKLEKLTEDLEIIKFNEITDYTLKNDEEILATFIIPSDKKKEIREELERLGIHDGTMFPELDKYGEYLKKKYSN